MATPFTEIYSIFLSGVTDFELDEMYEKDLMMNLESWLLSAVSDFQSSQSDINDYDLTLKQFNIDLHNDEKQILGKLMLLRYLDTQIYRQELLKEKLGSKDYRTYSPNEKLKSLQSLRKELYLEIESKITKYLYNINRLRKRFDKK